MGEYLSLEVLIMMLLMSFIENRSVNKNRKENKDKNVGLAVLPQSTLSSLPFPLTFLDLFFPLPIFLSLLFPFLTLPIVALSISPLLSPLVRLSISILSPLFASPLTVLFVPRVQELTLASLTRPLLGALRAAIGIKYSFISFITFILIGLSLNKSLIEPYY